MVNINENSINIFATVTRRVEEVYDLIGKRLNANEGYIEAEKALNKFFSKNRAVAVDLSHTISTIEAECQEEGYNQGFADAVKLFMTCMK